MPKNDAHLTKTDAQEDKSPRTATCEAETVLPAIEIGLAETPPAAMSKSEARQLWLNCTKNIRKQISDAAWQTTFSSTSATSFNQNSLTLQVPTALHKLRIERRYFPLLSAAIKETNPQATIRIKVNQDKHSANKHSALDEASSPSPAIGSYPQDGEAKKHLDTSSTQMLRQTTQISNNTPLSHKNNNKNITAYQTDNSDEPPSTGFNPTINPQTHSDNGFNPRFTFSQFVTGSSNRFAHAASLAVAEQPSSEYNPLFIYGNSGMGKTHLLQAIANYSAENHPDDKLKYLTSEAFLNEFVRAIRNNSQPDFKKRYRLNKMLLVDDIQFLQDKDGLQEEFFHTFNDILQAGGQIVLSSDRPPDAIPTLENRLRSRFRSGLITDIQPPDLVTRLAILQKKLETKSVHVSDDVLQFIAESIQNSIRELEGALIKIVAYTNLSGEVCNLELAKQLLTDIIENSTKAPVTMNMIIDITAETFSFTREQVIGVSRRRSLVDARQIAMYITRNLTELSYPEIGRGFGDRDHTTVMHAFRKIQSQISEDQDLFNRVQQVQNRVNQAR